MKVRAIKRGFFGGIYRTPGDEFDCPAEAVSINWMQEIKPGFNKPITKLEGIPALEIPSLMDKPKRRRKPKVKNDTIQE